MVGRFLTDLSPVRTHSHRTVGMVIGMSVIFLIPHAFDVDSLPTSVTMTVTTSGSYLGTNVPPCFRICDGRMNCWGQVLILNALTYSIFFFVASPAERVSTPT